MSELDDLLEMLADRASAPGVTIYPYSSRARSDHRPDSDVAVHVRFGPGVDHETVFWRSRENETDFAVSKSALPGRREILDGPDALKRAIESAPVITRLGSIVAVDLPPKP